MSSQVLDVGCGDNPKGSVNCDLNIGQTLEGGDQKKGILINPKEIRNFVRCDCHFLPFQTNSFESVVCSHVIEHIATPRKLLLELIRVAKHKLTVRCPHRFSRGAKFPFHIHFFNKSWFAKALKHFNCKVKVNYETCPVFFVGVMRVSEIKVEVFLEDSFC